LKLYSATNYQIRSGNCVFLNFIDISSLKFDDVILFLSHKTKRVKNIEKLFNADDIIVNTKMHYCLQIITYA